MADAALPAATAKPGRETIAVRNVRKYFGPTRALDGVNFSARAGEIHAVVGGNGCGKSTLAKVVSGILPVDGGTVSILGESPSTPAESRALGISTVYQEVLVADEASVVDNIFMGADTLFTKTLGQAQKVARAAQLMEELSGEPVDPHALAGTLPLSLKQWLTIARALLSGSFPTLDNFVALGLAGREPIEVLAQRFDAGFGARKRALRAALELPFGEALAFDLTRIEQDEAA